MHSCHQCNNVQKAAQSGLKCQTFPPEYECMPLNQTQQYYRAAITEYYN